MGSLHGPQAHAPVAAVPGDATSSKLVVASFYKFADLADYEELRQPIRELCEANRVSGGIILAPEGVNGSICGTRTAVDAVLRFLHAHPRLGPFRVTEAPAGPEEELLHGADGAGGELLTGYSAQSPLGAGPGAPFRWDHVRVKLKKEVVSMGVDGVNPAQKVGTYVKPGEWNRIISNPDVVVIDVRNVYETRIGKFRGAVDPATASFRQFPAWVRDNLSPGGEARGRGGGGEAAQGRDARDGEGQRQGAEEEEEGEREREREAEGGRRRGGEAEGGRRGVGVGGPIGDTQLPEAPLADHELPGAGRAEGEEKGDEEEESEEGGNVGAGQRDGGGRGGSLGADVAGRLAGEGAPSPPRTSQVAARRVAMYCTGGIRCEKASSYMLGLGYDEVYHLEGGILKYLEEVAPQESLWEGECFVFDKRVSVGPDLQPGSYGLCYSCKQPVSAADVQSPFWEEGVSCPHCHAWKSEREKERARARQLQVQRWGTVGGPDGGRRERAIARRMHGKKKALSPRQLRRAKSA